MTTSGHVAVPGGYPRTDAIGSQAKVVRQRGAPPGRIDSETRVQATFVRGYPDDPSASPKATKRLVQLFDMGAELPGTFKQNRVERRSPGLQAQPRAIAVAAE